MPLILSAMIERTYSGSPRPAPCRSARPTSAWITSSYAGFPE
jgi:hypothetical protein